MSAGMSATLRLFVVAPPLPSDNAGVESDADRRVDEGGTRMIDLYRTEMTARYSVQENVEWAARERLARQARSASRKSSTSVSVVAHYGLLSRLVLSFGHAV